MPSPRKRRKDGDVSCGSSSLQQLAECVKDKSDILRLADPAYPGFAVAARDNSASIIMQTMKVPESPIVMMKACAPMPCTPAAFLQYLDLSIRPLWDDNFHLGRIHHRTEDGVELKYLAFHSPIPMFVRPRDFKVAVHEELLEDGSALLKAVSAPRDVASEPFWEQEVLGEQQAGSSGIPTTSANNNDIKSSSDDTTVWRGSGGGLLQKMIQLRSSYVRGDILLSGFIARSVSTSSPTPPRGNSTTHETSGPKGCVTSCHVTYIALVHPNGKTPPSLVNILIGKQTSALKSLQQFIAKHPIAELKRNVAEQQLSGVKPTKSKL